MGGNLSIVHRSAALSVFFVKDGRRTSHEKVASSHTAYCRHTHMLGYVIALPMLGGYSRRLLMHCEQGRFQGVYTAFSLEMWS